jgi:hypothetical protein
MIGDHLAEIENVQSDGGTVLVKWDGVRKRLRCTVVISRADTDFVWRKDCDDIDETLREGLAAYSAAHPD